MVTQEWQVPMVPSIIWRPIAPKAENFLNVWQSNEIFYFQLRGKAIAVPSQDMILGIYYLTLPKTDVIGQHKLFANVDEVMIANEQGMLDLNAKIKTLLNRQIINTTAGRPT